MNMRTLSHCLLLLFCLAALAASVAPNKAEAACTGPSVVECGAVGNGTTDDTAAFRDCIVYSTVCWVNASKTYAVAGVSLSSGHRLVGRAVVEYGVDTASTTAARPVLVWKSGSSDKSVINVSSATDGAAIDGLFIDCGNSSAAAGLTGITGGSFQLTVQDTTVVNCNIGLGGFGSPYTGGAHIINSTFGGNGSGIVNLVDSMVVNVDLANNHGDGLYLGEGSNANSITNSRVEWNQGFGIELYGAANDNQFSNILFDANSQAGLRIVGASNITISNSVFNRNSRNNSSAPYEIDQASQIYMSAANKVSINGGMSSVGREDNGTGVYTPRYVFGYDTSTSTNISISGFVTNGLFDAAGNPSGSFTAGVTNGNEPVTGYHVFGVNDIPLTTNANTSATAYASGGQASATPLTAEISRVTTATASGASVKLTRCTPGRQQTVFNDTVNSIQVFGVNPDTINKQPTATGLAQAASKIATYYCTNSGNWTRLLGN